MFGDREQIEELLEQVYDSYEQNKHTEAKRLCQEACQKARDLRDETGLSEDETLLANALLGLGRILAALGELNEAEEVLTETVKLRRGAVLGQCEELSEALGELGLIYVDKGESNRAEALLREALDMDREDYSSDPSRLAWSLVNYGTVLIQLDRWPDAEKHFRQALDMLDSTPDTQIELVNHLLELSAHTVTYWFSENKLEKAVPSAWMAVELARNFAQAEDRLRVSAFLSLADLSLSLGRLDQAKRSAREALYFAEELLDTTDAVFADLHSLLGQIHLDKEDLEGAEQHLLQAVRIYQSTEGQNQANIVECLLDLGEVAVAREDFAKAESIYRKALAEMDRSDEDYQRLVTEALSQFFDESTRLYQQDHFASALVPAKLACQLATDHRDFSDKQIPKNMAVYPKVLTALDKPDEAEPLFHAALQTARDRLGKDNAIVADILTNLGDLYLQKSDKETAKKCFTEALEIYLALEGDQGPNYFETKERLARTGLK